MGPAGLPPSGQRRAVPPVQVGHKGYGPQLVVAAHADAADQGGDVDQLVCNASLSSPDLRKPHARWEPVGCSELRGSCGASGAGRRSGARGAPQGSQRLAAASLLAVVAGASFLSAQVDGTPASSSCPASSSAASSSGELPALLGGSTAGGRRCPSHLAFTPRLHTSLLRLAFTPRLHTSLLRRSFTPRLHTSLYASPSHLAFTSLYAAPSHSPSHLAFTPRLHTSP